MAEKKETHEEHKKEMEMKEEKKKETAEELWAKAQALLRAERYEDTAAIIIGFLLAIIVVILF